MNKKTLLTSLLLFCLIVVSYAQDNRSTHYSVPSKNEYLLKDPLWYISIGSGVQTYIGEDDNKGPFSQRITYAPTLTVGRRFGNLIGLRLQLTGGSLHGFNDGDSGFYTKWSDERFYSKKPNGSNTFDPQWNYMGWENGVNYVFEKDAATGFEVWRSRNPQTGKTGEGNGVLYMQHLRYMGLSGDVTLNLLNLINGYKPRRTIEVTPFAGLHMFQRFAHIGNLTGTFFGGSFGVNGAYNFPSNFGVFAEARGIVVPDEFDGQIGSMSSNGIASATIGVTYKFGAPKYIDPAIETRLNLPYNIAQARDGMVLIPGGNTELGGFVDPLTGKVAPTKAITVSPFWMDETEVTNQQYREFVFWVRDSIIRERLSDASYGGDPTFKVLVRTANGEPVKQRLNWLKPIPWKNPTAREKAAIQSVIGENTTIAEESGLNTASLNFRYDWFDSKSYYAFAISSQTGGPKSVQISKDTAYVDYRGDIIRETLKRETFGDKADFTNTYIINIYPDVLSWMTDFANARNEQYAKNYFTLPLFDRFPVVGVSWEQADAYCAWRTDRFRAQNPGRTAGFEGYRLPTEAEWTFAAKNGRAELSYPWFSDQTHTTDGLAHANFIGSQDLKDLVSPVATFLPNRFGLYDMAGNVSEWTTTTYTESSDLMTDEVNPDYSYRAVLTDPSILKRKIVKGGSWRDSGEAISANSRSVEYQDKGRSYIGFRCVRSWGIDEKGKIK